MIEATRLAGDARADYVFEVKVEDHSYTVWFSRDYYQKLTDGKISAEELVKKSFEFLLAHESPGSILPEFDLSVIARNFPEYEKTIQPWYSYIKII